MNSLKKYDQPTRSTIDVSPQPAASIVSASQYTQERLVYLLQSIYLDLDLIFLQIIIQTT